MKEERVCKNCADYDEDKDYCANEYSPYYTTYGLLDNGIADGCEVFVTQCPTTKQVLDNMKLQLKDTEKDNEKSSFVASHGGKQKVAELKVIIDALEKQLREEESNA